MTVAEILAALQMQGKPANVAGMARYGINTARALGVPVVELRRLARQSGRSHKLAAALWDSAIHEARILATIVDIPSEVTRSQMNRWARDFDSWDVCDQACSLFRYTPFAWDKAVEWARAKPEFVRRAGFSLMAGLAVKAPKDTPDARFEAFFPLIVEASTDDRNMVKKAVNWALRGIGKRNRTLLPKAIATAEEVANLRSRPARWIAADALRELRAR